MKKRNLGFVLLASVVTLGFYNIYWFVVTRNEMVKKGADIPSAWLGLLGPILLLGTAILQIISNFVFTTVTTDSGASVSSGSVFQTTINIFSILAGFVGVFFLFYALYWLYKYCVGVGKITKNHFSRDAAIISLLVFSLFGVTFIWSMIAQSYFNKVK